MASTRREGRPLHFHCKAFTGRLKSSRPKRAANVARGRVQPGSEATRLDRRSRIDDGDVLKRREIDLDTMHDTLLTCWHLIFVSSES